MSNQVAVISEVHQGIERMASQFKAALPAHVSVDKFVRVTLTPEQIQTVWVEHGLDDEAVEDFARAIEQAVLQSPEVQVWRLDAERFKYLRDNAQLFSHFGESGNSGWCVMRRDSAINRVFTYNGQELVEAIDNAKGNT